MPDFANLGIVFEEVEDLALAFFVEKKNRRAKSDNFGVGSEIFYLSGDTVGEHSIVLVETADVLTFGFLEGVVDGDALTFVFGEGIEVNFGVFFFQFLAKKLALVGRTVVNKNNFNIFVGTAEGRTDGLEKIGGAVKDGDDDRN